MHSFLRCEPLAVSLHSLERQRRGAAGCARRRVRWGMASCLARARITGGVGVGLGGATLKKLNSIKKINEAGIAKHMQSIIEKFVLDNQSIIERFNEFPKDKDLLFICAVGARSGLAAEYASSLGIDSKRLFNIEDGTPTWIKEGLPTSYNNDS